MLEDGEHLAEALDREEHEVRVDSPPDADDLDSLTPERMVGVGHRDVFGRQLG